MSRFTSFRALASLSMLALVLWVVVSRGGQADAVGMTFTVNSSGDVSVDGCENSIDCTLREAITAANANDGIDTINFLGPITEVALMSELTYADASDGLVIDGGTGVTIHEFGTVDILFGLVFVTPIGTTAQNVTVRNVSVTGFGYDGFQVCGGNDTINHTCIGDINNVMVEGGTFSDNTHDGLRFMGTTSPT
jgi:CSLREA domain-containing protein